MLWDLAESNLPGYAVRQAAEPITDKHALST